MKMGSATEDFIKARGGRRFKVTNNINDNRPRDLPKPPQRRKVSDSHLVQSQEERSTQMRIRLGRDSSSSLSESSVTNLLGDSRVPVLISRNKRHELRHTRPLPAIGKCHNENSSSTREMAVESRVFRNYRDRFPLCDEPKLSDSCVTVGVRLLDGRRVERRFIGTDRLGCVLSFAEEASGGSLPGSCELLVSGMAEKTLGENELEESVRDLGIRNRTLLYLQERDIDG
jgi:hypothetical protein